MKLTKALKFQKTFKLLLITSFLSVFFICLQCVNEKPVAQTTKKTFSVAAKMEDKGPALKIESPNAGTSEIVTAFPATLSTIPLEKSNDTFSPNLFPDVVYPTSFSKNLGFYLPNWIVTLHTTL